jgi:Thioredoxin
MGGGGGVVRGVGVCREVKEDEFFKAVTASKLSLCVFVHRDFPAKCEVLDSTMRKLAPFLPSTRLIKMDAEKAPFVVGKLKVRVIPTTVWFIDGVAKGSVLGLDGVSDDGERIDIEEVGGVFRAPGAMSGVVCGLWVEECGFAVCAVPQCAGTWRCCGCR